MAASYTHITVDQATWTTDEKTKSKKALAWFFGIKNPDGTLDISGAAALLVLWQKKNASLLRSWYKDAKAYEDELASDDFDIVTE